MSARPQEVNSGIRPIAVGTGLLALDIVYSANRAEPLGRWAGGTCGNVLAILSCLGWSTHPVARLAPDEHADLIDSDLDAWGVHLDYVTRERLGSTPIIVHRIGRDAEGLAVHRFSFFSPDSGRRLPTYRPVPVSEIKHALTGVPGPSVFFFDRVSRGAVDMGEAYRQRGAVVVFEPSAQGDSSLFERALAAAHIVKVSHERRADQWDLRPRQSNWLVIETLGANGLRFFSRLPSYQSAEWEHLPACELETCRDAAGAGDWCTAGIISSVARQGSEGLSHLGKDELYESLQRGQLLAAWNCRFEGARGGLYSALREELRKLVVDPSLLRLEPRCGGGIRGWIPSPADVPKAEYLSETCP